MEYVRITAVTQEQPIILASNSPRRRELLALGQWTFSVRPADVDESNLPDESPEAYVLRLAEEKATACAGGTDPDEVILAADTTVTIDGSILGKPGSDAEAADMLYRLRGRRHQVHTAIAIRRQGALWTDLCSTSVPMRSYSDEEIRSYVASGDPLDKAGAYAIQHPDFHPVEGLTGCYASVMGLPLCHLVRLLRRLGMTPAADLPDRCQSYLHYRCPISAAVLNGEQVG